MFSLQQKQIVGLDIGSSDIKVVVINGDSSMPVIVEAVVIDLKSDTDTPLDRRQAEISKAIESFLDKRRLSPSSIICGLNGPEVIVRGFKFPHLSQSEIASAVKLEAEQIFPFSPSETNVEYKLMAPHGKSICGVLVAATKKNVTARHDLVRDLSRSSVKIGVDGLAMLNCMEASKFDRKNAAVLNIGSSYSTFATFGADGMPLIRDLPFGYDRLISRLAEDAGISFQMAKGTLFSNKPGSCGKQIKDLMAKICNKLIDEITRTVFYYKSQKKVSAIESLLVCGRLSQVPEFIDILSNALSEDVVLWNPLEKHVAEKAIKPFLSDNGSVFVVAAGLALRSGKGILSVDLLKGHGLLAKAGFGGVALTAAAVAVPLVSAMLMLAVYQTSRIEISMLHQQKADFQKKTDGLSDQIGLQKKLEQEKQSHQDILYEVNGSINKHTQWSPIIEEIVKSMPVSMLLTRLEIRQDSVSRTVKSGRDGQARNISVPVKTVRLNVRANQDDANDVHVRDFIAKLYACQPLQYKLDDTKISQDIDTSSKYDFVSYDIDLIMKPEL